MKYALRIGGTAAEFVSKIDPDDKRCWPPGDIETVQGWDHPDILFFDDRCSALTAQDLAEEIDGCHISVEKFSK